MAGLIAVRLLVGALEAPSYPINNRVVTTWFPERERATAIGFYTSGQFVGLAFLTPVLVMIQTRAGWHMVFVATGSVGVVWGLVWYLLYRQPHEFPGTNAAEIDQIRRGGGLVDLGRDPSATRRRFSGADLAHVLNSRKLWGVYIGQFALTSTLWFFLTWFPTYLVQARGMSFVKAGFLASLPFLAAFVGVLVSGLLSDALVRRGMSLGAARKTPIIAGLLLSASIVGANYVDTPALIIAFMTLAFFGNGLASITWSLVSAIAPERLIGLTGGVFNFFGNLSGIAVPIIVGYLARDYGFSAGLIYVGALARRRRAVVRVRGRHGGAPAGPRRTADTRLKTLATALRDAVRRSILGQSVPVGRTRCPIPPHRSTTHPQVVSTMSLQRTFGGQLSRLGSIALLAGAASCGGAPAPEPAPSPVAAPVSVRPLKVEQAPPFTPSVVQLTPDSAAALARTDRAAITPRLAPGLELNLWAAEPMIADPIGITFDDQGRLFATRTRRTGEGEIDIRGHPGLDGPVDHVQGRRGQARLLPQRAGAGAQRAEPVAEGLERGWIARLA